MNDTQSLYLSLPYKKRRVIHELIQSRYRRARNRAIVQAFIDGGCTQREIAARFRLTDSAVGKIRRGVMGKEDTEDLRAVLRAQEGAL